MIAAGVLMTIATLVLPLPHARTGKGPAVVLVHGLGGDRHVWDDFVPKLAATHTVITIDLPGHGQAAAPDAFDADRIAKQIVATVRKENAAPAVIVGHSLGGFVSAHVPLVDATVVRGLVLVDIGIGQLFTAKEAGELEASIKRDRDKTLRGWFAAISQPGAQLERVFGGLRALKDATIFGVIEMLRDQPTPAAMLTVPTLLMASPLSLPGKKARAEELAAIGLAGVPKLEVVRFDRSQHWLFWDEPQKFTTTLAQFLARVER